MLLSSRKKIYSFDISVRYDALKDRWFFLERVKATHPPQLSKNLFMTALLDVASDNKEFRALLDEKAKNINEIGNAFLLDIQNLIK